MTEKKLSFPRLLLIGAILFLTSCSLFPGYTVLDNADSAGSGWNGVLGSASSQKVGLFYIHGMGETNKDFSSVFRKTFNTVVPGDWSDETTVNVMLPQTFSRRGESLDCENSVSYTHLTLPTIRLV